MSRNPSPGYLKLTNLPKRVATDHTRKLQVKFLKNPPKESNAWQLEVQNSVEWSNLLYYLLQKQISSFYLNIGCLKVLNFIYYTMCTVTCFKRRT
jgi:hypothetical protein